MGIATPRTGGAAACAGLLGPLIELGGFTPASLVCLVVTLAALVRLAAPVSGSIVEADLKGATG